MSNRSFFISIFILFYSGHTTSRALSKEMMLSSEKAIQPYFPALNYLSIGDEIFPAGFSTNSDYFMDQHSTKHHRVKKVLSLPLQNPSEIELQEVVLSNAKLTGREKRVIHTESLPNLGPNNLREGSDDIEIPPYELSSQLNFGNTSRTTLKFFQHGLISSLQRLCPSLAGKYSVLLHSVEEVALNALRSVARFPLQLPLKDDSIASFSMMQKIKGCNKEAYQRKLPLILAEEKKPMHINRDYIMIKENLNKEAKKYALLSQRDVVPNSDNVARLFQLIYSHVISGCLVNIEERQNADWMGKLLSSTLRRNKETKFGRFPTSHQQEMENLIREAQVCLHEFSN